MTANRSVQAGVVIIGGGQAGIQLADSLRTIDPEIPVTIVANEIHPPYQRPPLSKSLWGADVRTTVITLRGVELLQERGIRLITGVHATAIDRAAKRVLLENGTSLPYDALVLATGARPRTIALDGSDLPGVHQLRTLDDAYALQLALREARSLVVIGGGFIGLEIAASATQNGVTTTVLEVQTRILERALTATTSAWLANHHKSAGMDIRVSTTAQGIEAQGGRAAAVISGDGRRTAADLVVLGVGAVPNSELATEAGLEVNNGIIVDATLRTNDPAIWAIGDTVRFPSHLTGASARLESVQNATDHAKTAAKNIRATLRGGSLEHYIAVPWFWSNQGPVRLQIAGIGNTATAELVVRQYDDDKLSIFAFEDGRLTVVESLNAAADHIAARRILAVGAQLDPAVAADASVPLASVLTP
jgi:3-phenylpropionate/trans-cinnamate dioxygenase ferredoxin reductase subunit